MTSMTNELFEYHDSKLITIELEHQHLTNTFEYYHQSLLKTQDVLALLERKCGNLTVEILEKFQVGYSNRSLGISLPRPRSVQGDIIRGVLQRYALLKPNGHETFRGALLFPEFDFNGSLINVFGYRTRTNLNKKQPRLFQALSGPVIFNLGRTLKPKAYILCATPLEVLALENNGISHPVYAPWFDVKIDSYLALLSINRFTKLYWYCSHQSYKKGFESILTRYFSKTKYKLTEWEGGKDA